MCRFYEVAPPDGLLSYNILLTVKLQDGRNGSDSEHVLVEGMCAIFQNPHSNVSVAIPFDMSKPSISSRLHMYKVT